MRASCVISNHSKVVRFLGIAAVCLMLGVMLGSLPSVTKAEALGPWPMFQHDPQHTGRSPYVGPQTPDVKWVFESDAVLHSSVVGKNGTVYVASLAGLYALDSNGQLQWFYQAPGLVRVPGIAPDANIYTFWREGVSALAPDGQLQWFYPVEGTCLSNLAVCSDSGLLVSALQLMPNETKHVVLLALRHDGTALWKFDTGYEQGTEIYSSPAVSPSGAIYFAVDRTLFALYPDGNLKWEKTFGRLVETPPQLPDQQLELAF